MNDYSKLQELAEAATPGEWRAGNAYDKPFVPKYEVIVDTQDGPYVILSGNHNFIEDAEANIAFVGAANPVAVLSLLAEIERLRTAEGDAMTYKAGMENVAQQRDQIKAENEELRGQLEDADENVVALEKQNKALMREYEPMRKDAERYRWLRTQCIPLNGHDFLSSHEILDRRVDAKILKGADQ
jgi:hypothetical protein